VYNKSEAMEVVVYLTNKYQDNPYMSRKLEHYLENLPQVMQGIEEDYLTRLRLKRDLVEQRDYYLNWFVTHYNFYYHAPSERYLKCSRNTFSCISEDELVQFIMRSLHLDFNLHRGKQQMKRRLLRRVKANVLFRAQPTTVTLDNVVRSLQTHFSTATTATYFLTCVGDVLLGKRNLFFFMDPSTKPFLQTVAQGLYAAVNKQISEYFKFKYYDHDYSKSRIVPGVCTGTPMLRLHYLDLAVVATFLSNRYGSSDAFLSECGNPFLEKKAMMLHTYNTPALLVDAFLAELTEPVGSVPYKSVYFLWKTFLFKKSLPVVLSQHNFKQALAAQGVYDPATDACKVTPKIPMGVLNFDVFWSLCMKERVDAAYSLEEVRSMYHEWCEGKQLQLTGEECKEWVETFYPENVHGDTVKGFTCTVWEKNVDIENALEAHTADDKEVYEFYCEYAQAQNRRAVSKVYFNEYMESR
jgi:hypothetical protein